MDPGPSPPSNPSTNDANDDAKSFTTEVTTTPESLPKLSREQQILSLHNDNMDASKALVASLNELTAVLKQINYQLTVRP